MAEQVEKSSYTEGRDLRFLTSPEELRGELDVAETRYADLSTDVENAIGEIKELGAPSGDLNMLTIAGMCEDLGVLAVITESLYLSLMTLYELKTHQFAGRNEINTYLRMAKNCNVMARHYRAKVSEHAYDAELFARAYRPEEDEQCARIRAEASGACKAELTPLTIPAVSWHSGQEAAA